VIPQEYLLEPDRPCPPPQRQEMRVMNVLLPSAEKDYDFLFSATVRWVILDPPAGAYPVNPDGLAVDAVIARAREVAAQEPPARCSLAQHRLNGVLAAMEPDPKGRVLAMAEEVSLALCDLDLERLTKLSGVRKDEAVWEHERNHERNKRAYLGDDVLRNPGSAVVWWLSKNEEQIEDAVNRIGTLAQLSAAANNGDVDGPFRRFVPGLQATSAEGGAPQEFAPLANGHPRPESPLDTTLDEFLHSMMKYFGFRPDDPELLHCAHRLADAARAAGRTEKSDEIRRHFDASAADDDDQAPVDGSIPDPYF
jgi:hypothetical protein